MVLLSKNDGDTSASSVEADASFNEKRILELGKQLLKGRMFIGTLLEKYHVEKINAYRDVISIAENERQLIQALRDFTHHIAKFYPSENWWIGITAPGTVGLPKSYCLWVEIPDGKPLGKYWFKIRNVKFHGTEMIVSLKIERKVEDEIPKKTTIASGRTSIKTDGDKDTTHHIIDHLKETIDIGVKNLGDSLRYFFRNVTTPHNIKETTVFLCLLVIACVTGLFEVVKFLCDFLIKFMYAWSHFINVTIPILQLILNFLENIFKVLCTFVAYIFKPRQQPVYQTNVPTRHISYNQRQNMDHRRSIQYPKHGVIITELN